MRRLNQTGSGIVEILLIIIIVAILGFTGWFVWQGKRNTDKTLSDTGKSMASAVTTKASTAQYMNYRETGKSTGGVAILSASDVSKLTGASDKLKAYFAAALPNSTCASSSPVCSAGDVIVKNTVASTYGDFAAVYNPDSYEVVGPDPVSGSIVQIWGGQTSPLCSVLQQAVSKYSIPSGFYSRDSFFSCYPSANGASAIPYTSYHS